MDKQKAIEKLERLIQKGSEVLRTHRPNSPGVIGFPTLDSGAFNAWQTQCLSFLESTLPPNSSYVRTFREKVKLGYQGTVKTGMGILESVKEDFEVGDIGSEEPVYNPLALISSICDRFHLVARQLKGRHDNRQTLLVEDEYDVQDLLHALLTLYFDDIRPEEWTPSYAGGCSRMDFLLKQEQIVIEVKKTRKALGAKEVGEQLIIDIDKYKEHPDCKTLLCFVYDPEGWIANPRGIENDLNRDDGELTVKVLITPTGL